MRLGPRSPTLAARPRPVRAAPAARRARPARAAATPPCPLATRTPPPPPPPAPGVGTARGGRGTFALLAINCAVFALVKSGAAPGAAAALALNHARPRWFQLVTSAFVHLDYAHLSSNLLSLLVAGKMVEDGEGPWGVAAAYLVTAACASAAALAFLPRASVSVGASGACFGLAAVAVLTRLSFDPQRLLEGAILGQFVARTVLDEGRAQLAGGALTAGGAAVSHVAHLAGAAAGVLVVLLLARLPSE